MGQEFRLATGQSGKGAPTKHTEGCVGITYMDTDTKNMYLCTGCENGIYTWEPFAGVPSAPDDESGLPPVTQGDNGKILKVIDGEWAVADALSLMVEVDGTVYDLDTLEIKE